MNKTFLYGIHAVLARLQHNPAQIRELYIKIERGDKRIEPILALAKQHSIPCQLLTASEIKLQFDAVSHQGVIAWISEPKDYQESDLPELITNIKQNAFILILDGLTDPHNLGACLRSADAAAVDFVMIPKDKNVSLTAVVSKVACGAAETVPLVRVTNLARSIDYLKEAGIWVYGAAGETKKILYDLDCRGPIALVMGSEGKGLRRLTREHCDDLFALPMQGTVESLNVSVATGISLYEVLRQRYY